MVYIKVQSMYKPLESSKENIKNVLLSNPKPLLILDYDGTLNIYTQDDELKRPTERTKNLIKNLCKKFEVIIATGRTVEEIDSFFPHNEVGLYAEHGAHKRINGKWIVEESELIKEAAMKIEHFNDNKNQIRVETKKASIVVHHPGNEDKELCNKLKEMFENENIEIMQGKSVIDIRFRKNHKGIVLRENVYRGALLCAGDDTTDEDMFKECINKPNWFSVRITEGKSSAKYLSPDFSKFLDFLEYLLE